jgi:hypothetical protein
MMLSQWQNRIASTALLVAALGLSMSGCKKKQAQEAPRVSAPALVAAAPKDAPPTLIEDAALDAALPDAAPDCARTGPAIAGRSSSSPAAVTLQAQIIQWCIDGKWSSAAVKCIDNAYDASAAIDCVAAVDAPQAKRIADAVAKLAKNTPARSK